MPLGYIQKRYLQRARPAPRPGLVQQTDSSWLRTIYPCSLGLDIGGFNYFAHSACKFFWGVGSRRRAFGSFN